VKVRQSASLVAGVCTLCVAASGTVTPIPAASAAAPASAKSPTTVALPYELTAASDILVDGLNVASLPLQNFITVLNALAGAAGGSNGVGGGGAASFQALPNVLYAQLVAGTLTSASATTAINAATNTEQTALTNLSATPGKIITTDLATINKLLADLGFGSIGVAAAATPFKAAAITPDATVADAAAADSGPTLVNIANAASLPLQNFITVLNALAGAAGGGNGLGGGGATSLQALPNVLYAQLVAGTLTSASAATAITAALTTEQTALTNLAATPGKIIATDIATLSALFGSSDATVFAAKTNSVAPEAKSAAVAAADPSTTVVDAVNVASLPLQNGITALNALAGAAGGGNGLGGGGATSLQALPNVLYTQLAAGTLTSASATTAINAAITTEQAALTNLAATPGKIITTDVAAIKKLAGDFGGATTLATGKVASPLALNKSSVTPTVTAPKANKLTVKLDGPSTDGTSAAPTKKVKKTTDNNPVANAIKSISKGSYVGKHRADDTKSAAKSDDGSKGAKHSTK
jgi:ubiquinone biosynthesis protein UbiJ